MARARSSPREQRRLEHQDLSRAQLLDAAEEVFGRKGFYETTLKEVAELAEFSVGSVYSFFENKDDLFRQIFLRRGEQYMTASRALFASGDAPSESLRKLVALQVNFFREHRHFGRVYLRYSSSVMLSDDRRADAAIAGNYDESMKLQAELFRRGQAEGVFRDGDPDVLARLLSGFVSAYQAVDPAVVSDARDAPERLPLDELLAIIEGAFRA